MSLVRVLASTKVTLSHTFYVDELATDAAGGVTVTVKRLDGTVVSTGAAGHPGPAGVYQYAVTAGADPDALTVDWFGIIAGALVTARDHIEVVGGYLFGLAEARAMRPPLDTTRFPTAMLADQRVVVEQEFERICGKAFVPRFKREEVRIINGTALPTEVNVRAIRSVTINDVVTAGWQYLHAGGAITDLHASSLYEKATIEYEYGLDYPPEDIRQAAMLRLRARLTMGDNGVPSRATSFSVTDGGVYRLSVPSEFAVGQPEIDAVLAAHRIDVWGFA